MHSSVKKINNKSYIYVTDYIYVARGKNKKANASIGGLNAPLEKRMQKMRAFKKKVITEEVSARLKYWAPKILDKKGFTFTSPKKLEEMRSVLYRDKISLSEVGKAYVEATFNTDFIYNSNKLEGSKVPKKTIEEIIKKGGKSNQEVINSLNALAYIKGLKKLPNTGQLIRLHKILLAHEPAKHGLRKEPVIVGNAETLPFKDIPKALKELFAWAKKMDHKMYPPELAFQFYYRFERIHPFVDGNGRTGRLLMNFVLREHKYHPIVVWEKNRIAQMNAFQNRMDGSKYKFNRFMCEQMQGTYKVYLAKIKKWIDMESKATNDLFT
ncbi:MAG: Fic family protein [Candidatus Gracilibacteria bacterium]